MVDDELKAYTSLPIVHSIGLRSLILLKISSSCANRAINVTAEYQSKNSLDITHESRKWLLSL